MGGTRAGGGWVRGVVLARAGSQQGERGHCPERFFRSFQRMADAAGRRIWPWHRPAKRQRAHRVFLLSQQHTGRAEGPGCHQPDCRRSQSASLGSGGGHRQRGGLRRFGNCPGPGDFAGFRFLGGWDSGAVIARLFDVFSLAGSHGYAGDLDSRERLVNVHRPHRLGDWVDRVGHGGHWGGSFPQALPDQPGKQPAVRAGLSRCAWRSCGLWIYRRIYRPHPAGGGLQPRPGMDRPEKRGEKTCPHAGFRRSARDLALIVYFSASLRYPRSFVRLRLSRQQFWAMRCTMNIMPISLLGLIGFFAGCSSTHLNYRRPQMTADEIRRYYDYPHVPIQATIVGKEKTKQYTHQLVEFELQLPADMDRASIDEARRQVAATTDESRIRNYSLEYMVRFDYFRPNTAERHPLVMRSEER